MNGKIAFLTKKDKKIFIFRFQSFYFATFLIQIICCNAKNNNTIFNPCSAKKQQQKNTFLGTVCSPSEKIRYLNKKYDLKQKLRMKNYERVLSVCA